MSLNYSRPTLNLLKVREAFCHRGLQTTKAQTSLISALAVHKFNSIVFKLAPSEISLFYLVSVAEKAGFRYDLIRNPEDRFCRIDAHL